MTTVVTRLSALAEVPLTNLDFSNSLAAKIADSPAAQLITQKQQFFAAQLANLQQLDFSQANTVNQQLEQATTILSSLSGSTGDVSQLITNSLANGRLTSQQANVLQQLNSEVVRANSLANVPLGSSGEPMVTELSNQLTALNETVVNSLDILFKLPPAVNVLQGYTLAGALLTVVNGMASAIGIGINNYQSQINQMNSAQQLVQDSVNVALQLSAALKNAFNTFVQLAVSASATPPSDLDITSLTSTAASYVEATGANFWPSGLDPTTDTKINTPSAVWGDVNVATSLGQYVLGNSGIPFAGLVDDSLLLDPTTNAPLTIAQAIDLIASNPTALAPNYSSSFRNTQTVSVSSTVTAVNPMYGQNIAFLASGPGSPQLTNSLIFSQNLYSFIGSAYLSNNIVTTPATTEASVNNPLPFAYGFQTQANPDPSQMVAYLPMSAISNICNQVLISAGVFLPTYAYEAQFASALGPTSTDANGALTSVNTLGGVASSLAQIPANLNTTISNTEQQAEALVSSVTQLFQILNQLLTGSGTSAAFSVG